MLFITALAIGTGIACGLWGLVSGIFGLITFAGFAGTTTYFACQNVEGYKKVPKSFAVNLTGYLYACAAIYISKKYNIFILDVFITGLISFLMVYQNRWIKYLDHMPGAFMGCFVTFATGANKMTLPSMMVGYIVAMMCDYGGRYIYKLVGKES